MRDSASITKRPPRAISKLMKTSGELRAGSLGDLKGDSTVNFQCQQNGRHVHTWIPGDEIEVCSKCGMSRPKQAHNNKLETATNVIEGSIPTRHQIRKSFSEQPSSRPGEQTQSVTAQKIPITFIPWPGALDVKGAALYMGCSRSTIWNLKNLPKSNPRRLRFTSYGKVPVFECDRQMKVELEQAA